MSKNSTRHLEFRLAKPHSASLHERIKLPRSLVLFRSHGSVSQLYDIVVVEMSVAEISSADSASASTLTLHVGIGQFFVIIFLITELVLHPLRELFKDGMVHCAARRAVAEGNAVRIRSAPLILRALGSETIIAGNGCGFAVTQIMRTSLILSLIIATALFDRKIDEDKVAVVSTFSTTSLQGDIVNVTEGGAILMSPFPLSGVREEDAGDIVAFSPTGSNSSSVYAVREEPNLAAQYILSCVKKVNDSYTRVHVGAVIRNDGVQTVQCLDGTNNSENRTAAVFFSNPSAQNEPSVQTVTLSLLRKESGISSDGISGVFAATVLDDNGTTYRGYVAVTRRSHFDSNVIWSMYGLVRRDGPFIYRLSVRLYQPGATDWLMAPCYDELPSVRYAGTWTFDGTAYVCPDGIPRPMAREENEELQSVSLDTFPDGKQAQKEENGDLLVWLLETDYARFVGAQTFALELRTRVRSDRMFYSLQEGERIAITTGKIEDVVTIGLWETWIVLGVICILGLSIICSCVWKLYQRRTLGIKSDVVSIESVARMYSSEVRKCPYPRKLLLQVGLRQGLEGTPQLGIVEKDSCV
ncbi:hypothetical protein FGB62_119g02 [Gracilaria domingensis]|nr:hypothetical protein FGB62_119g02 [Gracilaria domingensis]